MVTTKYSSLSEPVETTEQLFLSNLPMLPDHRALQPAVYAGGEMREVNFESPLCYALKIIGAEAICEGTISAETGVLGNLTLFASDINASTCTNSYAGNILAPNVTALLALAKPSPFGHGYDTVYDDNVRKGLELGANQFSIDNEEAILNPIKTEVQKQLFPRMKNISFKRYKMHIYQEGGHFDFHRDTLHEPNHQATLLLEVRSAHEGGTFVIDHDGKLFEKSFEPKVNDKCLKWLAFYTDAKHKVEPVTSGTRMVIQYDVIADPHDTHVYIAEPPVRQQDDNDALAMMSPPQLHESKPLTKDFNFPQASISGLQHVLHALDTELPNSGDMIGIPLFHLYRSANIKAQYLKNADRQLLVAILATGKYEVGLSPVIVSASSYEHGNYDRESTYYKVCLTDPLTTVYVDNDNGNLIVKHIDESHPMNTDLERATMVYSSREVATKLTYKPYVEWTGNEAQAATYEYFHGVMIIRRKEIIGH
jgi:hypothetical protein